MNTQKYFATRFYRAGLDSKTTSWILYRKWHSNVPIQDFTPHTSLGGTSDIDWNKSIPEIDQQLYKKYKLTAEEIEFIETRNGAIVHPHTTAPLVYPNLVASVVCIRYAQAIHLLSSRFYFLYPNTTYQRYISVYTVVPTPYTASYRVLFHQLYCYVLLVGVYHLQGSAYCIDS